MVGTNSVYRKTKQFCFCQENPPNVFFKNHQRIMLVGFIYFLIDDVNNFYQMEFKKFFQNKEI